MILKLSLLLLLGLNSLLYAKEKSNFKLGMGIGVVSLPEYIGASNTRVLVLPYPYIDYSNNTINIKKNKFNGTLYKKNNLKIDLSFSGTLPTDKTKDSLRYGMNDLDPTIEIGPNFIFKIKEDITSKLLIMFPVRTIFSINSKKVDNIGYSFNPAVRYNYYINKLKISLSTGPSYSSKKYYKYFYDVEASQINQNRNEYYSNGGYGGWKTSLGFSSLSKKLFYGVYIKYYHLNKAEFIDSPLVDTKKSVFFASSIGYIF